MYARPAALQTFIDEAQVLFRSPTLPDAARGLATQIFERLTTPQDNGQHSTSRYPACTYLDEALAPVSGLDTPMGRAARSIKQLEPFIGWQRRTSGVNGSDNYVESHVNGMIVGPGGMESRYDVQLGFSLLAPDIRYPDHQHVPQEAYVLFTEGTFWQEGGEWFDPGVGGGLYNRSNILHAMQSREVPFLAMWCLLVQE